MTESTALDAENEAALELLKKKSSKKRLTRAEISFLRRHEKRRDGERRQEAYAKCLGKDLCAILGVQRKQLTRYTTYGMPRNEDGSYNLAMAVQWLRQHEVDQVRKESETAVDALEQQRQARAQMIELELQRKKNEVAPVDHFRAWIWEFFHGLSAQLQSLPRLVANSRDEETRLAKGVRKLLESAGADLAGRTGGRREKKKPPRKSKTKGRAKK